VSRDAVHTFEHDQDPLLHNEDCDTCNMILRRAFNDVMPELQLGPAGADMLLRRITEIAAQLRATEAAS
jgi:hypothetical protein